MQEQRFLSVFKHQFFACLLALAILAGTETAGQSGLDGGADHHGTVVFVRFEGVEQGGGKAEVALHKLFRVLWAVDSSEVEDEVAILAPSVEFFRSRIDVVGIDSFDLQVAIPTGFPLLDIVELGTKVSSHEAFGTGY